MACDDLPREPSVSIDLRIASARLPERLRRSWRSSHGENPAVNEFSNLIHLLVRINNMYIPFMYRVVPMPIAQEELPVTLTDSF